MAYSNEASGGPAEAVERITRSTIVSGGLLAMGAAFVVEYQGYARSVAAVMLFSGAVLFSAGMGVALKLRVDGETTARDAGQFEWYMRACTMPLSALLVTLFVAADVWAVVSGNGTADLVYLGVAATLTATLFLELVLFAAIVLSGRYPVTRGVSTDARQTQWALGMALMPVGLVAISPLTGDLLWQIANQQALEVRYPLLWFVVWSVGLVAQLTWGSPRGGLGDELMRACLASALSWGLVAALLGMVALGMLVLVGAQAVVTAVPVVFSLVLWVIGLRLWWQVRRADGV